MAEVATSTRAAGSAGRSTLKAAGAKRGPSIHQIYALPAPFRKFPLPTFYPDNPLYLFHVVSAWLGQLFRSPAAEPSVIHQGVWSEATTSVHVRDEKSMRALWEQGFYGKGSLSRSEPTWLKREKIRRGLEEGTASEIVTVQRREERAQAKWARARLEQDALRKTRLEEAGLGAKQTEMTILPACRHETAAPVGPQQILSLPNSSAELLTLVHGVTWPSGKMCAGKKMMVEHVSGESSDFLNDGSPKEAKIVRFVSKVESTTFELSDPPSPQLWSTRLGSRSRLTTENIDVTKEPDAAGLFLMPETAEAGDDGLDAETGAVINREHLQLMPEEALFLCYGLGGLSVWDPRSGKPLSTRQMVTLFRQHSYFPPRIGPEEPDLSADDRFLVHYAVYHHFRSLGWVPRAGLKFGVDWLLYTRGPVFDHAEFGLIVIPSYTDSWWKNTGKQEVRKEWTWLHGTIRVLSHATKSLVLVYVDVPPTPRLEEALVRGFTEALRLYRVKEVMVKRWSSNRNR